jgi:hypothetical protein
MNGLKYEKRRLFSSKYMPPMLNEIIMEFGMSSPVFNMPVRLKKSLDPVRVPMEFDTIKSSK